MDITGTTLEWALLSLIIFFYVTGISIVLAKCIRSINKEWEAIDNERSPLQNRGRSVYRNPGKDRTTVRTDRPDGQFGNSHPQGFQI